MRAFHVVLLVIVISIFNSDYSNAAGTVQALDSECVIPEGSNYCRYRFLINADAGFRLEKKLTGTNRSFRGYESTTPVTNLTLSVGHRWRIDGRSYERRLVDIEAPIGTSNVEEIWSETFPVVPQLETPRVARLDNPMQKCQTWAGHDRCTLNYKVIDQNYPLPSCLYKRIAGGRGTWAKQKCSTFKSYADIELVHTPGVSNYEIALFSDETMTTMLDGPYPIVVEELSPQGSISVDGGAGTGSIYGHHCNEHNECSLDLSWSSSYSENDVCVYEIVGSGFSTHAKLWLCGKEAEGVEYHFNLENGVNLYLATLDSSTTKEVSANNLKNQNKAIPAFSLPGYPLDELVIDSSALQADLITEPPSIEYKEYVNYTFDPGVSAENRHPENDIVDPNSRLKVGNWFNPNRPGHGWDLFWFTDSDSEFNVWVNFFTYEYFDGEYKPLWIHGVGNVVYQDPDPEVSGDEIPVSWEGDLKVYRNQLKTNMDGSTNMSNMVPELNRIGHAKMNWISNTSIEVEWYFDLDGPKTRFEQQAVREIIYHHGGDEYPIPSLNEGISSLSNFSGIYEYNDEPSKMMIVWFEGSLEKNEIAFLDESDEYPSWLSMVRMDQANQAKDRNVDVMRVKGYDPDGPPPFTVDYEVAYGCSGVISPGVSLESQYPCATGNDYKIAYDGEGIPVYSIDAYQNVNAGILGQLNRKFTNSEDGSTFKMEVTGTISYENNTIYTTSTYDSEGALLSDSIEYVKKSHIHFIDLYSDAGGQRTNTCDTTVDGICSEKIKINWKADATYPNSAIYIVDHGTDDQVSSKKYLIYKGSNKSQQTGYTVKPDVTVNGIVVDEDIFPGLFAGHKYTAELWNKSHQETTLGSSESLLATSGAFEVSNGCIENVEAPVLTHPTQTSPFAHGDDAFRAVIPSVDDDYYFSIYRYSSPEFNNVPDHFYFKKIDLDIDGGELYSATPLDEGGHELIITPESNWIDLNNLDESYKWSLTRLNDCKAPFAEEDFNYSYTPFKPDLINPGTLTSSNLHLEWQASNLQGAPAVDYYKLSRIRESELDSGQWEELGSYASSVTGDVFEYHYSENGSWVFRLVACNNFGCSVEDTEKVQFDIVEFSVDSVPTIESTPVPLQSEIDESSRVMAVTGDFRVNEQGLATYNIPIVTGPASGGMTPSVSLSYQSIENEGLMGLGWSLAAGSSITRCPKNREQDGFNRAVQLDDDDRFCLDGQRLVLNSSDTDAYGNAGTQYRLEIDSRVRIDIPNVTPAGPDYFILHREDGTKVYFGKTDQSRVRMTNIRDGIERIYSWNIEQVVDHAQNCMVYAYEQHGSGNLKPGEIQLSKIYYSGNLNLSGNQCEVGSNGSAGSGWLHYNEIDFEYSLNIDGPHGGQPYSGKVHYIAGNQVSSSQLLHKVTSRARPEDASGLEILHQYRFGYDSDLYGRAKLRTIHACWDDSEGDTNCAQPTTFTWSDDEGAGNGYQGHLEDYDFITNNPDDSDENAEYVEDDHIEVFEYSDVNNDGKQDLVYSKLDTRQENPMAEVFCSLSGNYGPDYNGAMRPFDFYRQNPLFSLNPGNNSWTIFDADLDGKQDFIYSHYNSVWGEFDNVNSRIKYRTLENNLDCVNHLAESTDSAPHKNLVTRAGQIVVTREDYAVDRIVPYDVNGDGLADLLLEMRNISGDWTTLYVSINRSSSDGIFFDRIIPIGVERGDLLHPLNVENEIHDHRFVLVEESLSYRIDNYKVVDFNLDGKVDLLLNLQGFFLDCKNPHNQDEYDCLSFDPHQTRYDLAQQQNEIVVSLSEPREPDEDKEVAWSEWRVYFSKGEADGRYLFTALEDDSVAGSWGDSLVAIGQQCNFDSYLIAEGVEQETVCSEQKERVFEISPVDINGDGLTDFVSSTTRGIDTERAFLRYALNTGRGITDFRNIVEYSQYNTSNGLDCKVSRYLFGVINQGCLYSDLDISELNRKALSQVIQPIDYDGDSYLEVLVPLQNNIGTGTYTAFHWDGAAFSDVSESGVTSSEVEWNEGTENYLPEFPDRTMFLDYTGDGLQDYFTYINHNSINDHLEEGFTFYRNVIRKNQFGTVEAKDEKPGLITTIDNGLGAVTNIDYSTLTDPDVYTVRDGINDSDDFGVLTHVLNITPAMSVVKSVTSKAPVFEISEAQQGRLENGEILSLSEIEGSISDSDIEVQYFYEGLRLQTGGRGPLGFEVLNTFDPTSGVLTTTKYRQDFPFVGRPAHTLRQLIPGGDVLHMKDIMSGGLYTRNGSSYWEGSNANIVWNDSPRCTLSPMVKSGEASVILNDSCTNYAQKDVTPSYGIDFIDHEGSITSNIERSAKSVLIDQSAELVYSTYFDTGSGSWQSVQSQITMTMNTYDSGAADCINKVCELTDSVSTTTVLNGDHSELTPSNGFNLRLPYSKVVSSTMEYLNADTVSGWIVNRVKNTSVTQTLNYDNGTPSSVTRKSCVNYVADDPLYIESEVVEPQNLTLCDATTADAATVYEREPTFGLVTATTSMAKKAVSRRTETEFDTYGRYGLKSYAYPDYEGPEGDRTLTGANEGYDKFGNPALVRDGTNAEFQRFGMATAYRYDRFGRLYQEYSSDETNIGVSQISFNLLDNHPSCPFGNEIVKASVVTKNFGGATSVQCLDSLGREVAGGVQAFDYGSSNKVWNYRVKTYGINTLESFSSVPFRVMEGSGTGNLAGTYTLYDEIKQPVTVIAPPLVDPDNTGASKSRTVDYHYGFREVKTTNSRTNHINSNTADIVKARYLNGFGDEAKVVDAEASADEASVAFEYDVLGNNVITDGPLPGSVDVLNVAFDLATGEKRSMNDPDMGTWHYRYNGFGDLICQKDAKGNMTYMVYDGAGRMTHRVDYTNAGDIDLLCGENGNYVGSSGLTGSLGHNPDQPGFDSNIAFSTWEYELETGYLLSEKIHHQDEVAETRYEYDGFGRQSRKIKEIISPGFNDLLIQKTTYNGHGQPHQVFDPAPLQDTFGKQYHYNSLGYLSSVSESAIKNGQRTVYETIKEMDAWGNITEVAYGDELSPALTTTWEYDDHAGWMLEIDTINSDGLEIQDMSMRYDTLGNLVQKSDGTVIDVTFEMDPDISMYEQFGYTFDLMEQYDYDSQNRLTGVVSITKDNINNFMISENRSSYAYDEAGRIEIKKANNSPNPATYIYDVAGHIHAVGKKISASESLQLTYDANGNIENSYDSNSSVSKNFFYTPFNKLSSVIRDNSQTNFYYDANRSRYKRRDSYQEKTVYADGVEITYNNSYPGLSKTYKRYVTGSIVVPMNDALEEDVNGGMKHLHRDHIGSIHAITNASGSFKPTLSNRINEEAFMLFDAHGSRSDFNGGGTGGEDYGGSLSYVPTVKSIYQALNYIPPDDFSDEGFTGHEHVDSAGIIHMGGRIYDPSLGRMLQADPFIQDPLNTQNYDRYTYVLNNPLIYTDPTGYMSWNRFRDTWVRPIVAIAVAYYMPQYVGKELMGSILTGFTSGAVASGNIKGAAQGGFKAALTYGIGSAFDTHGLENLDEITPEQYFGHVLAHGIVSGAFRDMNGGKFGHGFASAATTAIASGALSDIDNDSAQFALATISGGTVERLTGGKFANGAISSAFVWAFNQTATENGEIDVCDVRPHVCRLKFALEVGSDATDVVDENIDDAALFFLPGFNWLKAPKFLRGLFAAKRLAGLTRGQVKTALQTAQGAYKGTTRVGHALSKHAGRNPDIWGKVTGSQKTWNDQAMKHMRDIFRGPGEFKRVTNDKGITFLEKRLSDGRGIRLNQDHTFKGFID